MPVQEEKPGVYPWIVFLGVSRVANPTSIKDIVNWSTGAVVGPRHILTAAHVCKLLDKTRRKWDAGLGAGTCRLVCIPGFHGVFGANTKIYPIGADAYRVSKRSLFTHCSYTDLESYHNQITRIVQQQNFFANDIAMYFLGQDLPASIPRALVRYADKGYLDPRRKRPLMAHGYPRDRQGRLMFASTHARKTFPAHFHLHDALLGPAASGGPVWVRASPKPLILGTISGFKAFNVGAPLQGLEAGPKADNRAPTKKTGKSSPLPKWVTTGVASRLTRETYLEVRQWLRKRK